MTPADPIQSARKIKTDHTIGVVSGEDIRERLMM